jgi:hypothetical protein
VSFAHPGQPVYVQYVGLIDSPTAHAEDPVPGPDRLGLIVSPGDGGNCRPVGGPRAADRAVGERTAPLAGAGQDTGVFAAPDDASVTVAEGGTGHDDPGFVRTGRAGTVDLTPTTRRVIVAVNGTPRLQLTLCGSDILLRYFDSKE